MPSLEHPTIPKNVYYIGLDGAPIDRDSVFPETRFGDCEVVDTSEPSFGNKRERLVSHYKDHILDVKKGFYDHRWPVDKIEANRSEEIRYYRNEICYLSQLKNDAEGKAYVDLWFHKLDSYHA